MNTLELIAKKYEEEARVAKEKWQQMERNIHDPDHYSNTWKAAAYDRWQRLEDEARIYKELLEETRAE